MDDDNTIAVIGVAGRFPGADSVTAFWDLMVSGGSGLRRVDAESAGPDHGRSNLVPVHGTASGLDLFDPADFGMTSREAVDCDPQTRLLLQLVDSVFRDAGRAPGAQPDTAVYVTAGHSRYSDLFGRIDWRSSRGMSLMTGTNADYTSSTLSYKYGFRGASVTVQTACSSSLVAVHQACQALLDGQTDLALAGGANVVLPLRHGYGWEQGGPVSRSGACLPFDDAADGTVFTSGGALVLLKRLTDARRDGDRVYAVIEGGAVNNDGAHKAGFTAPSVIGQAAVIAEAMMDAGIGPDDLDMIEGHATGTTLGDAIEWQGILRAFELAGGRSVGPCPLTAVKGNVGHLGHASGVVSLIKAVLATHHQLVPAIAGFTTPNSRLTEAPDQLSPLDGNLSGVPRHCGVSSFGIGGTNAHLIVGAAPTQAPPATAERAPEGPVLLGWAESTDTGRDAYRRALAASPEPNVRDVANSLAEVNAHIPEHFRRRGATVVEPHEDWRAVLASGPEVVHQGPETDTVGWVFSGEGSLPPTGVAAVAENPRTASAFATCASAFAAFGVDLAECSSRFATGNRSAAVTEPLILATSYALAVAWRDLGVEPDFVAGRGVGEVCAGVIAGLLDLEDACRLVTRRARALDALPPVARISIAEPRDRVEKLLTGDHAGDLVVVAGDGLGQVTLEGGESAVERAMREATALGLRARRDDCVYPASSVRAAPVTDGLADITVSPRTGSSAAPVFVGLAAVDDAPDRASYWVSVTTARVRDDRIIERIDTADALILEIGAGHTGTAMINRVRPGRAVASLPDGAGRPDQVERALVQGAARVWAAGHDLNWSTLRERHGSRRARLPGRALSGTRHWPSGPIPALDVPAVADRPATATPPERFPGLRTTALGWAPDFAADPASPRPGRRSLGILIGECGPRAGEIVTKLAPASALVRLPASDDLRERIDSAIRTHALAGLDHLVLGLGVGSDSGTETLADQWRAGFGAVAAVAAALHSASLTSCDVTVVTTGGIDITGGEPFRPGLAAVGPLLRTLVREGTVTRGAWCDVSSGTTHVNVPDIPPTREVSFVAVRGPRAWGEHAVTVGPVRCASEPPVGGHYLITGGTGALAGVLARRIARVDSAARVTLLARRRRELSPAHHEAEELGARLHVVSCDLADTDAVIATVDDAVGARGPFHAVYHLAGSPGAGVTALGDHSRSAAVQAKVYGTRALLRALERHTPPTLLVGFSSRAALTGQPGGGDYAAANAVMEALLSRAPAERVVNIAWAAWSEIGMAVPYLRGPAGHARGAISTADADPFLERLLTEALPGRVLVEVDTEGVPDEPLQQTPLVVEPDAQASTPAVSDESVMSVLSAMWRDLLGVAEVDVDADFFESGGNSLTAVELSSRVEDELGIEVDLVDLFEAPTLRSLAALVEKGGE